MGFRDIVADQTQATKVQSRLAYRPAETLSLVEGWQQITAGQWTGIDLLEPLPEMQAAWGEQVLIVEPGRDLSRLRQQYPDAAIFTPKEFQGIIDQWPESEGVLRAKRAFSGDIVGGVA